MSMKITRLTTHWYPDEAHTIVEFLDRLRDELWETYGDEITTLLQHAAVSHQLGAHQTKLPLDDDIEF